ncbi:mRNA interferase [Mycolicibacterium madagascariense]|uniref:mRNA interferase n=1 Tax=Mycolicibacterium madagascariense TaxID=212765 RepID=A0A7I7X8U5_9MYCO|nr:type II toxin-antitoxin system PemK/MazF family toxin [Mycolicibacterium madagascariense]MCV7012870.1 type II toxin-antitoxin system PemK/MazF family toxin [Mycolicibacterium madagascariense]BBZ26116.1 mRNA interferase [Mycolicibacterium madagascariense]
MTRSLEPGTVVWIDLDPTVGREQAGRRPAVVVASNGYLGAVKELVIVVPATTRRRGWPQHVELTGPGLRLSEPTYAMTEQPRTISRRRVTGRAGRVGDPCLATIRRWLDDFLHD